MLALKLIDVSKRGPWNLHYEIRWLTFDTLKIDPSEINACDISSAVKPMLHVWAAQSWGETEHNEIWHAA